MRFNTDNLEQDIVSKLDKNTRGEKVYVTKVSDKSNGNVYVDIRSMYTNDEGEVRPTTKGIRLNSELMVDVIVGAMKALDTESLMDLKSRLDDM